MTEQHFWDFVIQQTPVIVFLAIALWLFVTDRVISGRRYAQDIEHARQEMSRLRQERDRFLDALLKAQDSATRSAEIARLTAEAVREVLQQKGGGT